jgi:hypothetical protein
MGVYFLPPEWKVTELDVRGPCGGCLCSKCVPPAGAFIRVTRSDPVEAWAIEDHASRTAVIDAAHVQLAYEVDVESTLLTHELEVVPPSAPNLTASVYGGAPGSTPNTYHYSVYWLWDPNVAKPAAPVSLPFTLSFVGHGHCALGRAACTPPAGDYVRVTSVTP